MEKLGTKYGEPIESKMVTKAVENAQKKVELFHFNQRKHLLEYDDVMNIQREVIYDRRRLILEGKKLKSYLFDTVDILLDKLIIKFLNEDASSNNVGIPDLKQGFRKQFHSEIPLSDAELSPRNNDTTKDKLFIYLKDQYDQKEELIGEKEMRDLEKAVMINTLDTLWKDHLYQMDGLRDAVGLRGYGQRDPLVEYKKESYDLLQDLIYSIDSNTVSYLYGLRIVIEDESDEKRAKSQAAKRRKKRKLRK